MKTYYSLLLFPIFLIFSCSKGLNGSQRIVPREVTYDIILDQPQAIAIVYRISNDSLMTTTSIGTHWTYRFNPQHPENFSAAHISFKSGINSPITGKAAIQINGIKVKSMDVNVNDGRDFVSIVYYIPLYY